MTGFMVVRYILVAAALSSALACSSSSSSTPASPTPPGQSVTVTIPTGAAGLTTNAFGANPLTISRGTTVTWMNSDNIAHTSTSNTGDTTTWSSGPIAAGGSFSFTFQNAGTFPYRCTIHPGMVGTLMVQ